MIEDTVRRIEQALMNSNISDEKRDQLKTLLGELRNELAVLSETDADRARSVAGLTEVSSLEATRTQTNDEVLDLSLQGLSKSVESFETDQPGLVKAVNSICNFLSNSGI